MSLKRCTITGLVDDKETFYKEGEYPYMTFVELFRSKFSIPVPELREFVNQYKSRV